MRLLRAAETGAGDEDESMVGANLQLFPRCELDVLR